MGTVERKVLVISDKDRKTMAYLEAGHAILAIFLPDDESDPIHKITIIPRGMALGHTQQLPLTDRHAYTKEYLLSRITILMGGRASEEICLSQQTTGAEDDFRQAVVLASKMVCQWGMTDELGPMSYVRDDGAFLGEQLARNAYSEETGRIIDREVKSLVESCYAEARRILIAEQDFLVYRADMLLINETLIRKKWRSSTSAPPRRGIRAPTAPPAPEMQIGPAPSPPQTDHSSHCSIFR
ncbi:MAG: hypothetical protein AB1545_08340 [Thermodesulfobacteriota bacterium]